MTKECLEQLISLYTLDNLYIVYDNSKYVKKSQGNRIIYDKANGCIWNISLNANDNRKALPTGLFEIEKVELDMIQRVGVINAGVDELYKTLKYMIGAGIINKAQSDEIINSFKELPKGMGYSIPYEEMIADTRIKENDQDENVKMVADENVAGSLNKDYYGHIVQSE